MAALSNSAQDIADSTSTWHAWGKWDSIIQLSANVYSTSRRVRKWDSVIQLSASRRLSIFCRPAPTCQVGSTSGRSPLHQALGDSARRTWEKLPTLSSTTVWGSDWSWPNAEEEALSILQPSRQLSFWNMSLLREVSETWRRLKEAYTPFF
jgi:hypothetical protein